MSLPEVVVKAMEKPRTATRLRILGMILDADGAIGMADMAKILGLKPSAVHHHLRHLRCNGFVVWEDRKWRTLRPTCRFIPADQLEEYRWTMKN